MNLQNTIHKIGEQPQKLDKDLIAWIRPLVPQTNITITTPIPKRHR